MYKYKNIIFEDVTLKQDDGLNDWTGICKACVNKFSVDTNKLDEDGSGCCMVLGCENEADYYIDFEEGELKRMDMLGIDLGLETDCCVCGGIGYTEDKVECKECNGKKKVLTETGKEVLKAIDDYKKMMIDEIDNFRKGEI